MSLPAGNWILVGNAIFPAATTFSGLSISATSATVDDNSQSLVSVGGSTAINITRFVSIASGSQTWYLVGRTGTALTVSNSSFYAVRVG
jgi:hypothetical protein